MKSHDVVAIWVEALHGQGLMSNALDQLLRLLAGSAALLMRSDKLNLRLPKRIEQFDLTASHADSQKEHAFGFDLFADSLAVMNIGSIISLGEAVREGMLERERVVEVRRRIAIYGVHDIVVIPLSRSATHLDYLEIHFSVAFQESNRVLLQIIAGTLARAWGARLPGTAEKAIHQHSARNARQPEQRDVISILLPSNPFDLSRSEFRVCTLIREGLLTKSISERLNVKDSTVRSHLRSIYMKTETTCYAELLFRLTA